MQARQRPIDPHKVAIYVRWSTEDQGEGTTLTVQLEGCKHYVLSQDWQVSQDLIFIDDGYSGGDLNRPALRQLRQAVQAGRVDCVVVYKLDRLSRSVIDTVNLALEEWDDRTHLKSAREPVDTTSPMGKQFFYMLVSYAEWERNVIKDRTFSGKLRRAQEGRNPGFRPPYGYRAGDQPGAFAVVPEEAAIVRRLFQAYREGKGMQALAYMLNAEGIPFRGGKPWNDSTISHILRNPIYLGHLVWGRQQRNQRRAKRGAAEPFWIHNDAPLTAVDSHLLPAIVDPADFTAVQALRSQRNVRLSGISGRALASPHLLTGLARCRCGHSLTAEQPKKGNRHAYYKCRGARTKGPGFCSAGYIRQDLLDALIVARVKARFLGEDALDGLLEELHRQRQGELEHLERAVAGLGDQLAELEAQLDRVHRDYRTGELSAARYERLAAQIETERQETAARLAARRRELTAARARTVDPGEITAFADQLGGWEALAPAEQKHLLRHWVHSITVYKPRQEPDVDVHIVYLWDQEPANAALPPAR